MDVKDKLEKEIGKQLEDLSIEDFGSDNYETAVNGVTKLLDKYAELEKIEIENANKVYMSEKEHELKLKQMIDERKDRFVKNVLTGVSVIGGIGVTVWGTVKSFKFEETGTITTLIGKAHLGNITKLFKR